MELVIDASVAIKWFLDEALSEKALNFRHQHLDGKATLVAPAILPFEIANALCTKTGVEDEAVLAALGAFYFTDIKEFSLAKPLARETARLSRKYKISVYDASYVVLAQTLGCQFITADEKLYRKIKSLKFVKLLGGG